MNKPSPRRSILVVWAMIGCLGGATAKAQKVYWTDLDSHKIQRADMDGNSVEDLVTGVTAYAIALDLKAEKMYLGGFPIRRANLDGSQIETIVTAAAGEIALDLNAGKLYWTDFVFTQIRRSTLDGTNVEDLVTTGLDYPIGIALDLATGQMYWTDAGYNKIQRANLDGSDVLDLVIHQIEHPDRIALDLPHGRMYWTAHARGSLGQVIQRAKLDGSDVETVLTTGFLTQGIAIDLLVGKVYWVESGRIRRANLVGSNVEDVVTGLFTPWGITLDPTCRAGGPDCQPNGVPDLCEGITGATEDCNGNRVPDECDIADGTSFDCNATGVPDECETDCNGNGLADECDIADGTSDDCDRNGIPDECDTDCNNNDIPDACDIADGTSDDCTNDGIPDECEADCNDNGVADSCDIADGTSDDCTGNAIPDECEPDCNGNGSADICDIAGWTSEDCTGNGIPDECEADCNENGVADSCDVADRTSEDCDHNAVPDECDLAGDTTLPCGIIEFAPGASTGPFEIEGNEIIIPSGGVQVDFEILLWGWGNVPGNPLLGAYNMRSNGESLLGSNAIPPSPGVDLSTPYPLECETDTDCRVPSPPPVVQTGTCGILFPGWCDDSVPGFFWVLVCSDDLTTPCASDRGCPSGALCVDNPRYIFPSNLNLVVQLFVFGEGDIQWAALPWMLGQGAQDPDGVTKFLGGVLRIIVPEDARGTYAIRFLLGPDFTFINDPEAQQIPSTVIHGQLTIGGACCMVNSSCEVLPETDCEAAGGTYVGGSCGDDIDGDGMPDKCNLQPLHLPLPPHDVPKHRYLSIDPSTNAPFEVAIKVEVAEMRRCTVDPRRACLVDEDCDSVCSNDLDKYCMSSEQCGEADCIETGPCRDVATDYDRPLSWIVQQPVQEPEGSGCKRPGCDPANPPPGEDNCCTDKDWVARLSDTMYSEDWSTYSVLHIGDCGIVPCVTYHVYACDPENLDVCSLPLEISTQTFPAVVPSKLYGDVAGGITLELEVSPPDGAVNVADLQVLVLTMLNYGGMTKPQTHPTWVDLHGLGRGIPPNYILNVADLQAVYVYSLTGGLPWVNTQGGLDPGDCAVVRPGDVDGDGDVQLDDFAGFQKCFAGEADILPGCTICDFEPDGDVDLDDYREFALALFGE